MLVEHLPPYGANRPSSAKGRLFTERKATIFEPCSVKVLHSVARRGAGTMFDVQRIPRWQEPQQLDRASMRPMHPYLTGLLGHQQ